MRRAVICAAILASLTACAGFPVHPVGRTLYGVVAPLYVSPKQALTACLGVEESYPPAGCGGVAVSGVNPRAMPGAHVYGRSGIVMTDAMRLVGTWDGRQLNLVQPPESGAKAEPVNAPNCPDPIENWTPQDDARARLLLTQEHGVLELQVCRTGYALLVAVADGATVQRLESRHPGEMIIAGWLQPV